MLGYAIVTLDTQGEKHRRDLLDWYTFTAQWSFLALAFTVQLFFGGRWAVSQLRPASEHGHKRPMKSSSRRLRYWLGQRASNSALSKGERALAALWTMWLLFLCMHYTHGDFLHLTRRFGAIGLSQLPLHYALGRRTMNTGLGLLTQLPHESMLSLHKVLGRIVFILFSVHAACYTSFFVQSKLLSTRVRDWDVIMGIGSYICLVVLVLSSLGRVRTWNYRLFYTTHMLTSYFIAAMIFLHTRHTRVLAVEILIIRLGDELARWARTRTLCGTVVMLPGTNLVRFSMATPFRADAIVRPGQHLLLGRPPLGKVAGTSAVTARLFSNPFTVASVPAIDGNLVLVCRASGVGSTARLSAVARSLVVAEGISHIPVTIEGPYGAMPWPATELLEDFEHVIVIAGGVGATFGAPVYRTLRSVSMSRGGKQVRFVWVVRGFTDTTWAFTDKRMAAELHNTELHVTHPDQNLGTEAQAHIGLLAGDVELGEVGNELSEQQHEFVKPAVVHLGRPNLSAMITEACTQTTGGVAVLVCGPDRMVSELWTCVRKLQKTGKHIYWQAEQFRN